jgi:hypothetical protein
MRIRENEERERLYSALMDATGESTKSGALDAAARFYLKMAGENPVQPGGNIDDAMSPAILHGSITAPELAECLNTDELPIQYEQICAVGPESGARTRPTGE